MSEKHRNYHHYHSNSDSSAGDSSEDACSSGVHEIPIPGRISDPLLGNVKVSGSDWKSETVFDEEVMYETTFRFYKTLSSKIDTLLHTKGTNDETLRDDASVADFRVKNVATESKIVKPKSHFPHVSASATRDKVTLKSELLENVARPLTTRKGQSSSAVNSAVQSNIVKPKSNVTRSATEDEVTLKPKKTKRLEKILRSLIKRKRQSPSTNSAKTYHQLKPDIREDENGVQQERIPSFFRLDRKLSESGLDFSLDPERSSLEFETEVQCDDEEHSLVSAAEAFTVQKSSDPPVENILLEGQTGMNLSEYRSEVCSYEFALDNVPFEVQDDKFASLVPDQQCRLQSDICTSHTDEIDTVLSESCQSESQSEKLCSESQIVCEEHITNGRTEIGPTAKHFSGSQSKEHLSGSLTEVSLPCASTEDDLDSEAEKLHPDDITSKERLVDSPIQQQDVSMKEQCFLGRTGEKGSSDVSTKVCLSDFSNEDYFSNVPNVEHLADAPTVGHVSGSHAEECLSDFAVETFTEKYSSDDLSKGCLSQASEKERPSGSHSVKHFPEDTRREHFQHSPAGEFISNSSDYQNNSETQTEGSSPEHQVKEVPKIQIERLEVKIPGHDADNSEAEMSHDVSLSLFETHETEIQTFSAKVQTEIPKGQALSLGTEVQECQLEINKIQNEEYIPEAQTKSGLTKLIFQKFPTENHSEIIKTDRSSEAQAKVCLSEAPREASVPQSGQYFETQNKESLSEVPCEILKSQAGQSFEENLSEIPFETSVSEDSEFYEECLSEMPFETSVSEDGEFYEECLSEMPFETSISQTGQSSEVQAKESMSEVSGETSIFQAGQSSEIKTKESLSKLPYETSISQAGQSAESLAKESLSEDHCKTSISQAGQSAESLAKESLSEDHCKTSISQAGQSAESLAKESLLEDHCKTSISQAGQYAESLAKESLSEDHCKTSISQAGQSAESLAKESLSEDHCKTSISQAGQSAESLAKESLSEDHCTTSISQAGSDAAEAQTERKESFPYDPENQCYPEKTETCSNITSVFKADLEEGPAFQQRCRTLALNKDCPEVMKKGHSTGDQVNVSSLVNALLDLSESTPPGEDAESSSHQTMSSKESTHPWDCSEDSDEDDPPGNLWEVHHSGTETLAYCAGDKIGELEPFAYVLREDTIMSRCSYCFKSIDLSTRIECSDCFCAFYCDQDCQDRHLETHVRECYWLSRVDESTFPDVYIRLTALIISKLKDPASQEIRYTFGNRTYSFQDLPPADTDMTREDLINPDLKMWCENDYSKFRSFVNDRSVRFKEFLMVRYKVHRNSITIVEDPYQEIGRGVFFGLAGIDVSCYPNANVSYTGTTAHIVAAFDIALAERDKIAIRHAFDIGPRDYRQTAIQKIVWKLCDCKLCQSDEFEATITEITGGESSAAIMESVDIFLEVIAGKAFYKFDEEELDVALYCLKLLAGVAGTYHYSRLNILGVFSGCLFTSGRIEAAIITCKYLLSFYRYMFGPHNRYTAETLLNIGAAYQRIRRPEKARKYCSKALQVAYCTYGSEHPVFKRVRYHYILNDRLNWENDEQLYEGS